MRAVLLNPWVLLFAVVVLVGAAGGGYRWGSTAAANACRAAHADAADAALSTTAARDAKVDALGTHAQAQTAAGTATAKGDANDSAARIRTVLVPGPCRAADPAVVHELQAAVDATNAALGVGVRPASARSAAAHP